MGFLELIRKRSVRNTPGNLFWFGSRGREQDDSSRSLPALLSKMPIEVNTEHYNFLTAVSLTQSPIKRPFSGVISFQC